MDPTRSAALIRRLVAGDAAAIRALVERAATTDEPAVLVAVALVVPAWPPLLARAAAAATGTADRQVVSIAAAHLRGDADRALLLARDHLADHPADPLVAHIAAATAREEGTPS